MRSARSLREGSRSARSPHLSGAGRSIRAMRRALRARVPLVCSLPYAVRYWPNPAHKQETTEAGPPRWRPDKEPCPRGMTTAERRELLQASIPIDRDDPASRRFALRRTAQQLEFYDIKHTRMVDGEHEFHGHPATWVPTQVLRVFRDRGDLTAAEYRQRAQDFGCPP